MRNKSKSFSPKSSTHSSVSGSSVSKGKPTTTSRGESPQGSSGSTSHNLPRSWRCIGGHHAILEALKKNGSRAKRLLIQRDQENHPQFEKLLTESKRYKVEIKSVSPQQLDQIFPSHQGALLYVDGRPEGNLDALPEKALVLALDGIEDPHNLGAILRSSWLMGVSLIIIPDTKSADLTPTVHKVASGGVEHVPLLRVANFESSFKLLKEMGFWVYGLDGNAKSVLQQVKLPEKMLLVIGNEEKGLRKTTERICDEVVRLPQVTPSASFNASVAAALGIQEYFRTYGKIS